MSDEAKHTLEPWTVGGYITYGGQRRIVGDVLAVKMTGPCHALIVSLGADEQECECNARLIAAAPDMLAALMILESYSGDAISTTQVKDIIGAAIAKATGKA